MKQLENFCNTINLGMIIGIFILTMLIVLDLIHPVIGTFNTKEGIGIIEIFILGLTLARIWNEMPTNRQSVS